MLKYHAMTTEMGSPGSPQEIEKGLSNLKAIHKRLVRAFGSPTLARFLTEQHDLQSAKFFESDNHLQEYWGIHDSRFSEYHDASFWNLTLYYSPDPENFTRILAQCFYDKPARVEGVIPIGVVREIVAEMASRGKIKPSSRTQEINAVYQSLEESSLIPFSFTKGGDCSFGIPFRLD